jgi:hypothetical protein
MRQFMPRITNPHHFTHMSANVFGYRRVSTIPIFPNGRPLGSSELNPKSPDYLSNMQIMQKQSWEKVMLDSLSQHHFNHPDFYGKPTQFEPIGFDSCMRRGEKGFYTYLMGAIHLDYRAVPYISLAEILYYSGELKIHPMYISDGMIHSPSWII